MIHELNETHDARRTSWIESANRPGTDFPLQNLPFCVFRRRDAGTPPRVGIGIGDKIFDVYEGISLWLFDGLAQEAAWECNRPALNFLMALGRQHWSALRQRVSRLLGSDNTEIRDKGSEAIVKLFVPMTQADLLLPADIGDYTDFYASVFHATNVGRMFRPDNPLLPNYKHVPIGYHGRASSVVASGTPIVRPAGQTMEDGAAAPTFGPSRSLDYELEVGFFVGPGNELGHSLSIAGAENHIFGLCLVNDWSARDIQRWEYQPLGPFLAKSFATTVSPWVVTLEALAPFRVPAFKRPAGDPEPLPYLDSLINQELGGINLDLEVSVRSDAMRAAGLPPFLLSRSNFRDMYWTIAQMVTHHASNGCNLRPGDLIASGTVSGPEKDNRGCLLELTWRGAEPISLPTGEMLRMLRDGDEVIFRGRCRREGFADIGFGECTGVVVGRP